MARNENDLPENAQQQQVPMILPGQAPGGQPPVAVVEPDAPRCICVSESAKVTRADL